MAEQIDDAHMFSTFLKDEIPDAGLVDAGLGLLLQTELFGVEYTKWLAQANGNQNLGALQRFLAREYNAKRQNFQSST